ncbi:OTU domain-containing protein 6B-like [Seriola lalandi dorsalis]|uniref:OTU domain-containing protein 6B-like n=1 Tax=Seriola lalandi dorsalis TaxID=1841481 RepID=UPI000C6FC184|nr:OTU domain-containing protein 6B-like [Seriola lalandi dorsalis]
MKNAVPKNDKKRRKQLTEEIAKLEADLSQKHEEELRQLKSTNDTKVEQVINGVETMKMEDGEQDELKQPRVTKAQKRRVSYRFLLKQDTFNCCLFLPTAFDSQCAKDEALFPEFSCPKRQILNNIMPVP